MVSEASRGAAAWIQITMLGAVTSSSNGMLEVLHTQILDKETIDMESDDIIQRVIECLYKR